MVNGGRGSALTFAADATRPWAEIEKSALLETFRDMW
jgi:hypothetical protein